MNSSFDSILEKITPEVNGLIWVTNDDIKKDSEYHELINYLCDGKLYRFINQAKKLDTDSASQINIFVSHSFGAPFFIYQLTETQTLSNDQISNLKKLLTSNSDCEASQVFLLNAQENESKLTQSLKKAKIDIVI